MKNIGKKIAAFVALGVGLASSAMAALPTAATTALTEISTAVDDVEAGVWPVIGAAIVVFVIIKLVKRGASKV